MRILSSDTDIHNLLKAQGALGLGEFLTAPDMLEKVMEYQADLKIQEKNRNA